MELKECLHLYLPFYALVPDEEGACLVVAINDQSVFIDSGCDYIFDVIKPILRTMEDLTDNEKEMIYHTRSERIVMNVGTMVYQCGINNEATLMLLKMGVDIFGLIDKGLAIRQKHVPTKFTGFPINTLVPSTLIAKHYLKQENKKR